MNTEDLQLLSHRLQQRPCIYKRSDRHAEQKGIITGVNVAGNFCMVMDSYTGETYQVPARLVREVALFGPEDMPSEKYLRGYFS